MQHDVAAPPGSHVTLSGPGTNVTVDLYSEAGRELIMALWLKLATQFRVMYEPRWLGVPIIQLPADMIMLQELIWQVRPDVIVECGVAHGGSAVFYASLCHLLGAGRVLGVEVDWRAENRARLAQHPMREHIQIVEGSSTDPVVFDQVRAQVGDAACVLVVLDSNHARAHVAQELALYHQLVTPGSYLTVMDGAQAFVWDIPRGKREWRDDSPLPAIHEFLEQHPEFCVDPQFTRLGVTANPDGFLRRCQ